MKKRKIINLWLIVVLFVGGGLVTYINHKYSPSNTTIYLSPRVMALEDTTIGTNIIDVSNQISENTQIISNCTVIVKPINEKDLLSNDNVIEWNCEDGTHSSNYKSPEASYIVASFYSSTYYGGSVLNFATSYSGGCRDGSIYVLPNLNDLGWGNIISSADPIDNLGCNNAQMWANSGYNGATYTCYLACNNLDLFGFNNNAESIKVYR